LDVLTVKHQIDPSRVTEGKEILTGVVSMLVGWLDVFGGMARETEQTPYGEVTTGAEHE
jgi:hypothetical protein